MPSMGAWPAATKKVLGKWKQTPVRECRLPLKYAGFKEKQIIGNMTVRVKQQEQCGPPHPAEVNSHQEHYGFLRVSHRSSF